MNLSSTLLRSLIVLFLLVASCGGGTSNADSSTEAATSEASVSEASVDSATDAPSDSSVDVVNPTSCSTAGCEAGMLCVRSQTSGGAQIMPDDAGVCPPGRMLEGGQCINSPTFRCVFRPAGCNPLSCACASSICSAGSMCSTPSNDQVNCTLLAP